MLISLLCPYNRSLFFVFVYVGKKYRKKYGKKYKKKYRKKYGKKYKKKYGKKYKKKYRKKYGKNKWNISSFRTKK